MALWVVLPKVHPALPAILWQEGGLLAAQLAEFYLNQYYKWLPCFCYSLLTDGHMRKKIRNFISVAAFTHLPTNKRDEYLARWK